MKERVRVQGLHAPALRDGDKTLLFLVLNCDRDVSNSRTGLQKSFVLFFGQTGLIVLKAQNAINQSP